MSARLGVLIAGGSGARFGSPKALARFRGRTLVERAYEVLAASCDEVVVVAPAEMELPVPAGTRVADAIAGAGPLSALVAGLEARSFEWAMALAVDMPLVGRGEIRRLFAAADTSPPGSLAIVPSPGGNAQPLAAVYAPGATARLRSRLDAGERALVHAVEMLGGRVLCDEELARLEISAASLEDIDTPQDLVRLEAEASR